MRAGRLDRRVQVQVRSKNQDATGQEVEGWADAFKRWMGKRDVRANERYTSEQLVAEVETVFTGRFIECRAIRPDTHRFVYRGRVYEILGRTELGRRGGLEFACATRSEAKFGN